MKAKNNPEAEPRPDCRICPRLVEYRQENSTRAPLWYNGAVPSLGNASARLLIVGLAPGLRGGNRTGIPFTGDASGDVLFATLRKYGFAADARVDGAPALQDCMITNAVRCVPPANRPNAAEINACRSFLSTRIATMPGLRAILCLGRVAHDSVIRALGERLASFPFAHGARHSAGPLAVFDSFHCSRYNLNTGRLTVPMFEDVLSGLRHYIRSGNNDDRDQNARPA